MAAVSITPADLEPFAEIEATKAAAMCADALARAAVIAPCILEDGFAHDAAALAIIRGAILRWHESGTGAFQQVTTGPFGATTDTRSARKGMFLPSEIDELKSLCGSNTSGAFDIDTVSAAVVHADACSINLGATYCDCGADLAGFPLFGG